MPHVIIFDFFGVVFDPRTGQIGAGFLVFLERIAAHGLKCGIASSTDSAAIAEFLRSHNLTSYFAVIIGADKVSTIKPDPECYLKVAEYFHVAPSDCVIIDDSETALVQAKAAGFQTIYFGRGLDNFEKIAILLGL